MWVRFVADFDWRATPAVTFAYKAGTIEFVTRACAEEAGDRAEVVARPAGRKSPKAGGR